MKIDVLLDSMLAQLDTDAATFTFSQLYQVKKKSQIELGNKEKDRPV